MKLYTEDQVKKMLEVCRDSDLYEHILTFEDILKTETPIELPSDEEIGTIAMGLYGFKATSIKHVLEYNAFKRRARLILDKIQGGNNEQR